MVPLVWLSRWRLVASSTVARYSCDCNYFLPGGDHEAPGHAPHHDDHRRRAAKRRVLCRRARPADGEEDGELRCPRRLPPVLRGRAGLAWVDPDLVRVR